jgi:ACS family tartrate transporter-like MFS transporter
MKVAAGPVAADEPVAQGVRRKVFLRLIPWLLTLYVIAYVDRVNVSYATLEMSADLGFSPRIYGFGAGIFFVGYFLLEVPGAIIAQRWSVRRWLCRIMVTWGLVGAAMGFIHTATEFYWLRFLLGAAEAGFFPAILVYLNKWFIAEDRAKAVAWLMSAIPLALIFGGPVSGLLLECNWLGLAGWRWLFIIEGLPAVFLGIATLWMIPENPADARWLSEAEKQWLTGRLAAERQQKLREGGSLTLGRAFRDPRVLLLSAAYFFGLVASNGLGFWLPTIIKSLSGLSPWTVSLLVSLPYSLGFVAKIAAGWSSDRTGDRRWHTIGLLGLGAAGLAGGAVSLGQPVLALVCVCVAVIGLTGYSPSFWAHALGLLGGTAGAAAIGLINSIGNLGSFAGPYMMGWVRESSNSFTAGVLLLAGSAVVTAVLVFIATPGARRPDLFLHSTHRFP